NFATANDTGITIMAVEASVFHQEMFARHKDEYGPKIRQLIEKGLNISAIEYAKALRTRAQLQDNMKSLFSRVNALVTPGAAGAAPKSLATTGSAVMQGPWSVTGLPAISLPTGLSKDGLPLAIQLVGPQLGEASLFAVVRWCERALDVQLRPSLE
ncbi:MAG: amidase, partial [Chloroflexi bacterium]|nr:amidase [Chloroflexota bacterium]